MGKLKRGCKYRGYVCFEPVHLNVIPNTKFYLKTDNKFYENISILDALSSKEMKMFQILMNIKMFLKVFKKIISNETDYGSVEDPLSMHRNAIYN